MKKLVIYIIPIFLALYLYTPCYSQKPDHKYRATVHKFNEVWNTGRYDLFDEVVHPSYKKLEGDLILDGVESLKKYVQDYRESYIDVKINYIDEVYGDEKAAINFTIEGTPKESGKKFKAEGIVIFRFLDGKIVEDHSVFDQLSASDQQGYVLTKRGEQKTRILIDTDANNELDDQHALAYLLFNGNVFDVEGITINKTKNGGDIDEHYREAERIVQLCDLSDRIDIFKGATGNFEQIKKDIKEVTFDGIDAVNFIISSAKFSADEKLVLLPIGKLTNIALALYKDPSIASQIRIVWLGSNYPESGEYNQEDDRAALQYLLDSNVDFEIVLVRYDQSTGTDAVKAFLSDIQEIMPGKGPLLSSPIMGRDGKEYLNFGDYSVSLFEKIEEYDDGYDDGYDQARALFDMAAVAIVKNPSWAVPIQIPSPKLVDGVWEDRPGNSRMITIWQNFEREEIISDFYKTMDNFVLVKKTK